MSFVITKKKPATRNGKALDFRKFYRADGIANIGLIRAGLPAKEADQIIGTLKLSKGKTLKALALSVATFNRKVSEAGVLTASDSERVLGVARLIGQVETIVEESGDPRGFDAEEWLSSWLSTPSPALGDKPPIEFLDTVAGQQLVFNLLARMQSGAYA